MPQFLIQPYIRQSGQSTKFEEYNAKIVPSNVIKFDYAKM